VTWITFLAIFAMAARISVDTDTWWHLRAGEWILENRAVPQTDPFSYTRGGAPWQYPGWLVEVPMALIYRVSGPGGLNLWTAAMVTLTFAFLWRALTGGAFLRAFTLILAATASGVYWAARPYLVTFLFAAIFLWVLEDFRWGRADRLGWLPVLMAIWANSHGGFAVGILIWGVYLVDAYFRDQIKLLDSLEWRNLVRFQPAARKLLVIGGLLLVAVMVNPSGPVMILYPFKTVAINSLSEFIQEWQSPDFHSRQVQPFLWLLFATVGAIGFSKRQLALKDFLLFTGFAYLSFQAGRNIALFALAAPLVLTRHAAPLLKGLQSRLGLASQPPFPGSGNYLQRILNPILVGVLLLAVVYKVSLIFPEAINQDYFNETLPVAAVDYLQRESPPGRLFNPYNWGGYLLWALPEYPVFIDGRTDLYDDDLIASWLQVVRGEPGWEGVLEHWEVNLVLSDHGMPLVRVLEDEGWRQLYSDDIAVLFARR
jgi:hypothetical protein